MWVYLYTCGYVEKYHICGLKVWVPIICGYLRWDTRCRRYGLDEGYDETHNPFAGTSDEYTRKKEAQLAKLKGKKKMSAQQRQINKVCLSASLFPLSASVFLSLALSHSGRGEHAQVGVTLWGAGCVCVCES